MQLINNFYRLSFEKGRWTELYDRTSMPEVNLICDGLLEPLMLRGKPAPTTETVTNYGARGVQSRSRNIISGCQWFTDNDPWHFVKEECNETSAALFYENSSFSLKVNYILSGTMPVIERSFELKYHGSEDLHLHEAVLTSPYFRNGTLTDSIQAEIYDTRNNLGGLRHNLGQMQPLEGDRFPDRDHNMNAMDNDFHHEVSALLHNSSKSMAMVFWGFSDQQEAVAYVAEETTESIRFDQAFWSFAELHSTPEIYCGKQVISCYSAASWKHAVNGAVQLKSAYSFSAQKPPADIKNGLIYQIHGAISDIGGFAEIRKRIPLLKELGVKIIYLQPLAGPEAYLNAYPDQVAFYFGREEELRLLSKEAHAAGMYVIADMIAHHVFCLGKLAENPSFIRYDELGTPLTYAVGTVLTETVNEDYRKYYIDCCRRLREECLIDGFRFDVAGFQLPNWGNPENRGYERPGQGVCGQTELLLRLRSELGKDTVILEEGMGVAGFRYITHGWIQLIKRFRNESRRDFEPIGTLLERVKIMLADRAVKERLNVESMLHTKIHDTAIPQQFGSAINGIDLPLTILCLTSDCVPLITHGMERGYFDMIRKLTYLRRICSEINTAPMDFDDVNVNHDEVLAFSRKENGCKSIVAINFSSKEISRCRIKCSGFSGKSIFKHNAAADEAWASNAKYEFSLGPYGAVIFRNSPVPELPPMDIPLSASTEENSDALPVKFRNCPKAQLTLKFVYNLLPRDGGEKIILSDSPDEGSMGGIVNGTAEKPLVDGPLGNEWYSNINGFEHWPEVFVPKTRTPVACNDIEDNAHYIEDVFESADEFSSNIDYRNDIGKSYFRKIFYCGKDVRRATLKVASPGSYKCCNAIKTGVNEKMRQSFNPCISFINGQGNRITGKYPGRKLDVTGAIYQGRNILAVAVERGNGSRGIITRLTLEYTDGSHEIIVSDASWQCFPGTIWKPVIKNTYDRYGFKLVPLETTIQSEGKEFSGTIKIDNNKQTSISLDQKDWRITPVWNVTVLQAEKWFACNTMTCLEEQTGLWSTVRDTISGAIIPVWQNVMFKMNGADFGLIGSDGNRLSVQSDLSKNSIYDDASGTRVEIYGSSSIRFNDNIIFTGQENALQTSPS